MNKLKTLLKLFFTMFKIGLFTFGGGYAMVVVLENEMVEKKGWIEQEEFYNLLAIAESTPGPIAINSSTYIGYKVGGILGSILATLGVVLPSFIIIYLISLFFDEFLSLTLVAYAFKGIQMAVCYLIFSAGVKMVKKLKKNLFNLVLFSLTFVVFITLTLLSIKFSSIFYILIGGISSLTIFSISTIVSRNKGGAR
jgi:chromate transporter